MRFGGARRLCVVLVACGLLGTACTSDPAVDDAAPAVDDAAAAAAEASETTGAADLRLALEQGFAFHAHLLAEAARASGEDPAAANALERNTDALSDIVADAYGKKAGNDLVAILTPLGKQLTAHSDQADAGGARPGPAVREAPGRLASYMADVTEQQMERDVTQDIAAPAVDSLIAAVEHSARRDFEGAYEAQREAFAQMLDVGRAFAAGISEHQPEAFGGARISAVVELRSALRQFLGEHAALTVSVTRAGAVGAGSFDAAAAALNGNTEDLVDALQSSYGTAAEPFARAWRQRISRLADYTVATAGDQEGEREDARRALRRSDEAVAAALDQLTDGDIGRRAMRSALTRLTAALIRQVDAVGERRFDQAATAQAQAFVHSLAVADVMAAGLAASRPEEYTDR